MTLLGSHLSTTICYVHLVASIPIDLLLLQGKALAKELSTVSSSCSSMRDDLAGIGASMHKVDSLVTAVARLSAQLDGNSAELTAVRQICEHVLTAVTSLRMPSRAPLCHHQATHVHTVAPAVVADAKEQQTCSKHSSENVPAKIGNVFSGPQHGEEAVKEGRLTAYFKRRKATADKGTARTAGEPDPQSGAAAGSQEHVQHAHGCSTEVPTSKRAPTVQVQSPAPSKAPRAGPDAPGPWRRKRSNAVYDSCLDSPGPARPFGLGKAAARTAAAGAVPHGKGRLDAGQAAAAVGQPDHEQGVDTRAQAMPADRSSISSLHLGLLPKPDRRGTDATAGTGSKHNRAGVAGIQGSQTATPAGAP